MSVTPFETLLSSRGTQFGKGSPPQKKDHPSRGSGGGSSFGVGISTPNSLLQNSQRGMHFRRPHRFVTAADTIFNRTVPIRQRGSRNEMQFYEPTFKKAATPLEDPWRALRLEWKFPLQPTFDVFTQEIHENKDERKKHKLFPYIYTFAECGFGHFAFCPICYTVLGLEVSRRRHCIWSGNSHSKRHHHRSARGVAAFLTVVGDRTTRLHLEWEFPLQTTSGPEPDPDRPNGPPRAGAKTF